MKVRVLLLLCILSALVFAESPSVPPDTIVENYCAATKKQAEALQAASMDVEIDASLPKLKKEGKLHALRHITSLGMITYKVLGFEGDSTVKNQVIARYLAATAEAQKDQSLLAVTPANYKFKYKGVESLNGRETHIFDVTPRKKRHGLFKGQVWIDSATFLKVQESGYLVKNLSLVTKRTNFVRKYEIRDGIAVPRQEQSVTATRLFGSVEMTVVFSNFSVDSQKSVVTGEADIQ